MNLAALLLAAGLLLIGIVLAARWLDAAAWRSSLLAIELRFPFGLQVADVNRFLNTVAAATHPPRLSLLSGPPIVLEVAANQEGIQHVLLVPKRLRETILSGLRAALPGVRLTELPDYRTTRPPMTFAIEATQTSQQRQMAVERAEGVATAVLATLAPLAEGETAIVQWLITGAGTPAPVPSVAKGRELPAWITGEELTDGEAIRSARSKDKHATLHCVLRVSVQAASTAQANAILGRVFSQHRGQNSPGVLLIRRWWLPLRWAASRLAQLTVPVTVWPLRLSTMEAAGLLPLPVGEVALPGVALGLARQLPPPPGLSTSDAGTVQIGVSNYPDMAVPLRLSDADRLHHLHVLGPTGTGKSTLLCRLILQDIQAGHGIVVIDPKSDLVKSILERIPAHRADDVIVLDPASTERPLGYNLMQAGYDEQSRELVVDHIIHIWHEIYEDFWGPRSEDVLRGALLSLINTKASNGQAFTMIETPDLLTSNPFRKFVTEQAGVPAGLASFWSWYRGMQQMDRLKVVGPILNKLRAATLRTPIRLMLGQSEGIDLDQVLAERKVLLVPLSAGTLGNETANLLGAVVLAGINFAVQRRVSLPATERHPVFIYVDEAQAVLKLPVDLADLLAQSRGLGAAYTLAHQHLGQIEDKQVKSALLGTVRSQILFQLMREDAATLAPSYEPHLTAHDLMGAAKWEFAARLLVEGQTLAPLTGTTLPLAPPIRDGDALAEVVRTRLGTPRAEVEVALKARGRAADDDQADSAKPGNGKTFGRRRKSADDPGASA